MLAFRNTKLVLIHFCLLKKANCSWERTPAHSSQLPPQGVLLKKEFFIKMKPACFQPSSLQTPPFWRKERGKQAALIPIKKLWFLKDTTVVNIFIMEVQLLCSSKRKTCLAQWKASEKESFVWNASSAHLEKQWTRTKMISQHSNLGFGQLSNLLRFWSSQENSH